MTTVQKMRMGGLGIVFACFTLFDTTAQTPYGWRGPERNGNYPETGLLKSWPTGEPELLWETMDAGKGYSSPVIVDDRIFLTGMNEDETQEVFSAYSLDGKKVYEVAYGSPWSKTYPETRTTPAIVGDKAYVISGLGEIVCIHTPDGKIVWKVEGQAFGMKTGYWGTSECPLVYDGKVIYTPSGDETTIVALDAQTGKTVWKSASLGDYGAYVSPLLITHNGVRQVVGMTANHILGVHPDTGEIMWTFNQWGRPAPTGGLGGEPGSATYVPLNIAPNTPLYKDGDIFFSQGYNIGAFKLRLNADATGVSLLWKNEDLDTHHGGQVLIGGVVYGSNHVSNSDGNWVAVDWETGKTKYNTSWGGNRSKGSIIMADDMLYCYDERRGAVGLVRPNPEKFDIVSEFRITKGVGPHWAHPVIVNGILYIRHGFALMAYKVK